MIMKINDYCGRFIRRLRIRHLDNRSAIHGCYKLLHDVTMFKKSASLELIIARNDNDGEFVDHIRDAIGRRVSLIRTVARFVGSMKRIDDIVFCDFIVWWFNYPIDVSLCRQFGFAISIVFGTRLDNAFSGARCPAVTKIDDCYVIVELNANLSSYVRLLSLVVQSFFRCS